MNKYIIGIAVPLFLCLPDFPESPPIVQFSLMHCIQQFLVHFGLQLLDISLKESG